MTLLDLPQEIVAHVLGYLPPQFLVRFGLTCRTAHQIVSPSNQLLWRSAFLHVFDNPDEAWAAMPGKTPLTTDGHWDWYRELASRLTAFRGIQSKHCGATSQAETYVDALLSLLDTAKFQLNGHDLSQGQKPKDDDRYTSMNLQLLATLVEYRDGIESLIHDIGTYRLLNAARASEGSRPLTRSMTIAEHERYRPASASRLHALYGPTRRDHLEHKARGAARRKVYDWHWVAEENDFSPILNDGTGGVDWVLLEAIIIVISRNFAICVEGRTAMPQGFPFAIPHRTLPNPAQPRDWARVTGPWCGTYSFLDYHDLFHYNTWEGELSHRPTLEDEPEDCGDLMKLDLNIDDNLKDDPRLQTNLPVCHDLPVLYFSGLSRGYSGMHRPVIGVRGTVNLIPGGREVRWRFIINYGGQDQWQLEGIQPGGIRSGGIYGLWTQCDHEEHGPIGPFCYFPEELCKSTSVVLVG
jgi:hypothetical protein